MICEDYVRSTGEPCEALAVDRTPAGRALCITHLAGFWEQREKTNRDYPDSDVPPEWFDPMAAGERWNEDDPWP